MDTVNQHPNAYEKFLRETYGDELPEDFLIDPAVCDAVDFILSRFPGRLGETVDIVYGLHGKALGYGGAQVCMHLPYVSVAEKHCQAARERMKSCPYIDVIKYAAMLSGEEIEAYVRCVEAAAAITDLCKSGNAELLGDPPGMRLVFRVKEDGPEVLSVVFE